jgi:hypothetical protein
MEEQHVQKGWLVMVSRTEVYVSCSHDKIESKLEKKNMNMKREFEHEKTYEETINIVCFCR